MTSDTRPLVSPRLVLGMVTFLLGGLFLADSVDMLRADSGLALWPVGLVALGLIVVLQPDTANRVVGAVLMVAGVWLLLNAVGVWGYRFWQTWPYLLIAGGAWMLYRVHIMREREGPAGRPPGAPGRFDEATTDADSVAAFAFLNRVERQATSVHFKQGEFSAVLGGCEIDLSRAAMGDGDNQMVIDVFALFGRIELEVPSGWRVENRVVPLIGRTDSPPQPAGAGAPTVVVQGSAILGRVAVSAAA